MGYYTTETGLMLVRRDATEGKLTSAGCTASEVEAVVLELDYVRGLAYSAGVTADDMEIPVETARRLAAEALR